MPNTLRPYLVNNPKTWKDIARALNIDVPVDQGNEGLMRCLPLEVLGEGCMTQRALTPRSLPMRLPILIFQILRRVARVCRVI